MKLFYKKNHNFKLYGIFFLLAAVVLIAIVSSFAHPLTAHAADTVAGNPATDWQKPPQNLSKIYEVLGKQNPVGDQIRLLWVRMMQIVNSLVVIVLIFIAFAEILRVNINTYGIKKILPTMILAVVAANFSFILCRFIVDIANVMLTLFLNDTDTKCITNGIKVSTFFNDKVEATIAALNNSKAGGASGGVMTALAIVVFAIVAAVITLILAFLFAIRNYMVYLLVIVSPIAFMAMIMPQTKTYFNQWWDYLVKWTFMPTISIALIWMGGQLIKLSGTQGGSLMGMVLSVAMLVLAIQVPFKMGGSIMQKWGDLGKKAWGSTGGAAAKKIGGNVKDYWTNKVKGAAMRVGNNWKMTGLNMVRKGNWAQRALGGSFLFGAGGDKAKAEVAFEEDFAKGLTEGFQARHMYGETKRGRNNAMRMAYRDNRSGELKEYRSYSEEDIFRKRGKQYETLKDWRISSGHARRRMAMAQMHMDDLVAQGTFASTTGQLMDKSDQSREAIEERMINEKIDSMVTDDEKKAIRDGIVAANPTMKGDEIERAVAAAIRQQGSDRIDPAAARDLRAKIEDEVERMHGSKEKGTLGVLGEERSAAFQKTMGMSKEDADAWVDFQRFVVTEKESTERLKGKAEKDILVKPTMDQLAVHEQAELSQETAITIQKFKELSDGMRTFIENVKNSGRTLSNMTLQQKAELSAFSTDDRAAFNAYLNNQGRATVRLREMGMLNETEDFAGSDLESDKKVAAAVTERYETFMKKFVAKKVEHGIPAYLRDVIHGTPGNYTISRMERTTYTRGLGVAAEKTKGRVADYSGMSVDTLSNLLTAGDKKDGISAQDVRDFVAGKATSDTNKRSRMMAMVEAMTSKLASANDATSAASFFINNLSKDGGHNEVDEMLKQFKAAQDSGASWAKSSTDLSTAGGLIKSITDPGGAYETAQSTGDFGPLQDQLARVYAAVPQNARGNINGIVRKFIHKASY